MSEPIGSSLTPREAHRKVALMQQKALAMCVDAMIARGKELGREEQRVLKDLGRAFGISRGRIDAELKRARSDSRLVAIYAALGELASDDE
eukprot:Clim_evm27s2 gene=Clim_evmTU27s2